MENFGLGHQNDVHSIGSSLCSIGMSGQSIESSSRTEEKTNGLCSNITKTKLEQNAPKRTQAFNFDNNQFIETKLGGESIRRMSARIVDHCYQRIYILSSDGL